MPLEFAQQAFDDLLQIALAFAQIRVLHLVKLTCHHFELTGQRPFGVIKTVLNPGLDPVLQHLVLQQHEVYL